MKSSQYTLSVSQVAFTNSIVEGVFEFADLTLPASDGEFAKST
ncbi:MAG: hypothetical protein ABI885_27985 [Gammaproteobacteria bacterium]